MKLFRLGRELSDCSLRAQSFDIRVTKTEILPQDRIRMRAQGRRRIGRLPWKGNRLPNGAQPAAVIN
jgi:hypothetical protein